MSTQRNIIDTMAYAWSVVLYPMFVPTYLMLLFCRIYSVTMMPLDPRYKAFAVLGTLFFTCLLPLCVLLIMMRLGKVSDLNVTNRSQRLVPYVFSLMCFAFWLKFIHILHLPAFMFWSAAASCLVLLIVLLITLRWKISAHLSSAGGALAMVIGMVMHLGCAPWGIIGLSLLCCWLLMLARIRLEAHTPLQTVTGFLLGLILVLIPNMILYFHA